MADMNFLSFLRLPPFVLEAILLQGKRPDVSKLVGWEFKGHNIGLLPRLGRILKFKKGFVSFGDEVIGYNVLVEQNSPTEPWIALPDESNPKRHGFFKVYPAEFSPKIISTLMLSCLIIVKVEIQFLTHPESSEIIL